MLVPETKIFTDSGWKEIKDISGKDKVLVRNFLGEAEFIQPFALRKKQYDGEIYEIGGRHWALMLTPGHKVTYKKHFMGQSGSIRRAVVDDLRVKSNISLLRRFRYIKPDTSKRNIIKIFTETGIHATTISDYDWYKLVAYIIMHGNITRVRKRFALGITIPAARTEEQIAELGDIFDRLGIEWSVRSKYGRYTEVRVNPANNTLAGKVRIKMGSIYRKKMKVPDDMVWDSSREMTKYFFECIENVIRRKDTRHTDKFIMSTSNPRLIEGLSTMSTLGGYSPAISKKQKPGGPERDEEYIFAMSKVKELMVVSRINKIEYSGPVYAIDILDGQVYAKIKMAPVWIDPQ